MGSSKRRFDLTRHEIIHPRPKIIMMSSAFALAKDDFENDDCDDKIKEHMKLVPVRYVKDFSCREEIVLHMDALRLQSKEQRCVRSSERLSQRKRKRRRPKRRVLGGKKHPSKPRRPNERKRRGGK